MATRFTYIRPPLLHMVCTCHSIREWYSYTLEELLVHIQLGCTTRIDEVMNADVTQLTSRNINEVFIFWFLPMVQDLKVKSSCAHFVYV